MGQLFSRCLGFNSEDDSISPDDIVIVVIGPGGVGKSTFINTAADKQLLKVCNGLKLCTTKVKHVRCTIPIRGFLKQVVLVDTPAFPDDGTITEGNFEERIRRWSEKSVSKDINFRVAGILYLYKITDKRMTSGPPHSLFRRLCGDGFRSRVLLVTTMWEKLKNREDGEKRMVDLERCRSQATDNIVVCHDGTKQSAWAVVNALLR